MSLSHFASRLYSQRLFLTAAVSFDEFAVSWFVSGLNKTLPVIILEIVQGNIDPQVNAIGTFVFLISMTLVVLAQVFLVQPPIEKYPTMTEPLVVFDKVQKHFGTFVAVKELDFEIRG